MPGLEGLVNTSGISYVDGILWLVIGFLVIMFAIVAIIILAIIFIKISKIYCIQNLEYRRYFEEEGVFEGEETRLIEEFTNHSFIPMFVVDVETHISSRLHVHGSRENDGVMQCYISRFLIMPYTKVRRIHKVSCWKRGYYRLESAKITYAGIEVYLDSVADIHVYPKELPFETEKMMNYYIQYSANSRWPLLEDRFSFAGIRQYMAGDSMSAVNYKQTARRGELMVNSREYLMGRKILMYINFQPNMKEHITEEKLEELLELELSCASYMMSQCVLCGYAYSMNANSKIPQYGDYVRNSFVVGEQNYQQMLCQMAEMGNRYGLSMAALMDMDIKEMIQGAEIFLFTMYMDEALEERIAQLERQGNAVNVIDVLEWSVR